MIMKRRLDNLLPTNPGFGVSETSGTKEEYGSKEFIRLTPDKLTTSVFSSKTFQFLLIKTGKLSPTNQRRLFQLS